MDFMNMILFWSLFFLSLFSLCDVYVLKGEIFLFDGKVIIILFLGIDLLSIVVVCLVSVINLLDWIGVCMWIILFNGLMSVIFVFWEMFFRYVVLNFFFCFDILKIFVLVVMIMGVDIESSWLCSSILFFGMVVFRKKIFRIISFGFWFFIFLRIYLFKNCWLRGELKGSWVSVLFVMVIIVMFLIFRLLVYDIILWMLISLVLIDWKMLMDEIKREVVVRM